MDNITICGYITFGFLSYITLRTIYRLWFHPLSHIPGPKLAAVTHLYEFYYDVIKGGMYFREIDAMHDKYGPVIRVNPREVHIQDPHYFSTIYAGSSSRRDKDKSTTGASIIPTSAGTTNEHQQHRQRRAALENLLTPSSIKKWEPLFKQHITILTARIQEALENDTVINLPDAFSALTTDNISCFINGTSLGILNHPDFDNDLSKGFDSLATGVHILRLFPKLALVMSFVSFKLLFWLGFPLGKFYEFLSMCENSAREVLNDEKNNAETGGPVKQTLFDALTAAHIPAEEKTVTRLKAESLLFWLAGSHTSVRTLTIAAYHLSINPEIMMNLRKELATLPVPGDQATWTQLQELPYFTGVVKEALRLSQGISFRSARVSPNEDLVYKDIVLPAGTPLSQMQPCVHMDPSIFPDPVSFDPTRWTIPPADGKSLNTFLVAFGKGTRSCVGENFAKANIYLTLAALVTNFDFTLLKGERVDTARWRDMGLPVPEDGSLSMKVKVARSEVVSC